MAPVLEEFLVRVLDANDVPIKDATVVFDTKLGGVTDGNGELALGTDDPDNIHFMAISHPYYVKEDIQVLGALKSGAWNNPLLQRDIASGRTLLVVRLGRLIPAPTGFKTEAEIAELTRSNGDPGVAVLEKDRPDAQQFAYLGHRLSRSLALTVAETKLLPETPPAKGSKGWERFHTKPPAPVDALAEGRFFWLLHPATPKDPQYAVAVWSPNITQETSLETLDSIIFLGPNTVDDYYNTHYPYGFTAEADGQAFLDFGWRYLLYRPATSYWSYCFAYQLAAQKRQATIIMPINNKADMGPYTSREGLFRLWREVALFLHRECRTSSLGVTKIFDPVMVKAGGSLRSPGTHQNFFRTDFGVPPRPGRIVVGAYSAGVQTLMAVLRNEKMIGSNFDPNKWGCSPAPASSGSSRPVQMFDAAWKELWDLDTRPVIGKSNLWPGYLDLLEKWHAGGDGRRVLRMWHSERAGFPNPEFRAHRLWKKLLEDKVTVDHKIAADPKTGVGSAWELQSQRWSIVYLSETYVGSDKTPQPDPIVAKQIPTVIPTNVPQLFDGHHGILSVALSHGVTLSRIGT